MPPVPTVACDHIMHILQTVGHNQIGLAMGTDGRLDEDRLHGAIIKIFELVPLLGCRFVPGPVRGKWAPAVFEKADLLKVQEAQDPEQAALDFFTTPLDPYQGPLFSARIIRGRTDWLCLNVSHFVSDAAGVKDLAALLCEIYRGEPDKKPLNRRGLDLVSRGFTLWQKLGIAARALKDMTGNSVFPGPLTLPGKRRPKAKRVYVKKSIDRRTVSRALIWARVHGATLNDLLIAAFVRSLKEKAGPVSGRAGNIVATADLRRYLPAYPHHYLIANLSGWVLVNMGPDMGDTLEETCYSVSRKMNRLKADYLGLGTIFSAAALAKGLPAFLARPGFGALARLAGDRGLVAPSFTNMGRISRESLDFGKTRVEDAFLLPPIVFPPVCAAGVSGFRGTLTLVSGFCDPGFSVRQVERLLAGVEEIIKGL